MFVQSKKCSYIKQHDFSSSADVRRDEESKS